MMITHSIIIIPLLLAILATCSTAINVDPATNLLIDSEGRVRIFHGVNVVHKLPPYHPTVSTDAFDVNNTLIDYDMKLLSSLGMNVVRLGVMWPGVEPTKGFYNQTYLSIMSDIATDLGKHGIYTIVDFHQDLLHGSFCGEGVPDYIMDMLMPVEDTCQSSGFGWFTSIFGACKSFKHDYKLPIDPDTSHPVISSCLERVFATYYATPEVSSAFDKFFTDSAVHERMAAYFKTGAETFSSNPYVLGYDLFNEPFPGDIYNKPWLGTMGGKADKEHLEPLYEVLNTAIRTVDTEKLLFYEPVQFPGTIPTMGGIVNSVGFTSVPGGEEFNNRSVLSYHMYCCAAGFDHCDHTTGDVKAKYKDTCDNYVSRKYSKRMEDIRRIGGGGFLTEFGACSNTQECIDEINRSANNADLVFQSWAYWQYKYNEDITTQSGMAQGFFHQDGSLQREKLESLTRPYAKAIAGRPISMAFHPVTRVFELTYQGDELVGGNTVLHIHPWTYPDGGYDIVVNGGVTTLKADPNTNEVEIQSSSLVTRVLVIPHGSEGPVLDGAAPGDFKNDLGFQFVTSSSIGFSNPGAVIKVLNDRTSKSIVVEVKANKRNGENIKLCRVVVENDSSGDCVIKGDSPDANAMILSGDYTVEVYVKKLNWLLNDKAILNASHLGNIYGKVVTMSVTK